MTSKIIRRFNPETEAFHLDIAKDIVKKIINSGNYDVAVNFAMTSITQLYKKFEYKQVKNIISYIYRELDKHKEKIKILEKDNIYIDFKSIIQSVDVTYQVENHMMTGSGNNNKGCSIILFLFLLLLTFPLILI
tara:strand:- start:1747 stop:2148 length:402 start_codon:yes stop_codon:yes gene_type:complete